MYCKDHQIVYIYIYVHLFVKIDDIFCIILKTKIYL